MQQLAYISRKIHCRNTCMILANHKSNSLQSKKMQHLAVLRFTFGSQSYYTEQGKILAKKLSKKVLPIFSWFWQDSFTHSNYLWSTVGKDDHFVIVHEPEHIIAICFTNMQLFVSNRSGCYFSFSVQVHVQLLKTVIQEEYKGTFY